MIEPTSQQKILIVDDDPTMRLLMREYLEAANFHILESTNGEDAIEMLKETPR